MQLDLYKVLVLLHKNLVQVELHTTCVTMIKRSCCNNTQKFPFEDPEKLSVEEPKVVVLIVHVLVCSDM